MQDDKIRAKNIRLALVLAGIAIAIFVAFLAKYS
jgi:hypothetical protein